ncbi:cyclic nucleotide-gated ion channel 1-like [Pistacia vera]|uniref:cyclic nucleotide-gated ion channel 1-like n=1 Tax=Pistacia vera TaxID=55513 RepID=UPI00126347A3|nr:cyclic nucleotide-gated ion channel 1-like [Pistacia vera]
MAFLPKLSRSFFAEAKSVKAVFNLFLYLLGGHVFGELWYSFAIDKILQCWREDYFLRKNSKPDSFLCRDMHKNKEHVRCPKITQNVSEITAFGIFNEAIKSGIVERKPQFLRKILYCFRWGMQALRLVHVLLISTCLRLKLIESNFH